jgi:carbon starvation protein
LITITTVAAGIMNVQMYFAKGQGLNAWLSIAIIILVLLIIADNIRVWFKLLKTTEPVGMNDEREEHFYPANIPENEHAPAHAHAHADAKA